MEIIPEPDWEALCKNLLQHKGTAIIIGATDSGKSTLSKYLIRKFAPQDLRVCFIDSDVGQSSLCLPGTISMRTFHDETDIDNFRFERFSFIGAINPAKKIALIIDTVKRFTESCRKSSDITLIDTSGLVDGKIGEALKIGKIGAVRPEHIVAVQRGDELEHILRLIVDVNVHRIKTSAYAKTRTIATRVEYRKKKFDEYFDEAGISDFILYADEAAFLYNGRPFSLREGIFKKGTLIGLNHGADTLALGILEDASDNAVTFRSPLGSLRDIDRVIFGDITL